MIRQTQLEITWDGPIPSLAEQRISLSLFGPALNHLLVATRRIASNMVSKALEPAETGRFANEARQVDVEIAGVLNNSSGVSAVLTFQSPDAQQPLFNQLTEAVGVEFLESIEEEANGHLKNSSVRRYLQALPYALTRQKYFLHENGRAIKTVVVGAMNLARIGFNLPELREVTGRVSGVSFSPAPDEVRIRSDVGHVTALASPQNVQRALDLRETVVRAVIVSEQTGDRLLSLEDTSLPRYRPDPEYFLFKKWEKALRELA